MKVFNNHNGSKVLSLDDDFLEYSRLFSKAVDKSVYFLPSYLKSVQCAERYPVKIVVFVENNKFAMIPYIRRRINDLPLFKKLKHECWDIISPHEYSYAISNITDKVERNSLFVKLFSAVANYCKETNVISEFVRFDPFLSDINCIKSNYNIRKSCDNIYIDLRRSNDEIWKTFHSSARKNIKRALGSNLSFLQTEKDEENIDLFIKLYSASMERLKADRYFYFSDEHFKTLIGNCEGASLFFVNDKNNQHIAASILLHYENVAHHHLTGYTIESTALRPNDYMIYSLVNWGKVHNLQYLHLGGGAESICNFKAKFSDKRIPFYVGYRVHDREMYQLLCDIWQRKNDSFQHSAFFPLYRLEH